MKCRNDFDSPTSATHRHAWIPPTVWQREAAMPQREAQIEEGEPAA
jgi:hypothetical protein